MKTKPQEMIVEFQSDEQAEDVIQERIANILNRLGHEVTPEAIEDMRWDCLQEGLAEQERLLIAAKK